MKRKIRFFGFLLILILAVSFSLSASEEKIYEVYNEALGFQAGEISGTGLSYQTWNDGVGFQYTFGALYLPIDIADYANVLDYNIAAEVQYSVYGEDFAKWLSGQLYLFGGLNHRGFIPVVYDEEFTSADYGSYTPVIAFGLGIGIEVVLFKHFSVPFEIGYGFFWYPTKSGWDQFLVNLIPQGGFRYRF